jgi:hypothetical protein
MMYCKALTVKEICDHLDNRLLTILGKISADASSRRLRWLTAGPIDTTISKTSQSHLHFGRLLVLKSQLGTVSLQMLGRSPAVRC